MQTQLGGVRWTLIGKSDRQGVESIIDDIICPDYLSSFHDVDETTTIIVVITTITMTRTRVMSMIMFL